MGKGKHVARFDVESDLVPLSPQIGLVALLQGLFCFYH